MFPPSPCIGLCRIDPGAGLCAGCARSAEEIALWRDAGQPARDRIWAELPARRARLGIGIFRPGWTRTDLQSFLRRSLEERSGTWTVGVHGAIAEFSTVDAEPVSVEAEGDTITASNAGGRLRFTIGDGVRALAFTKGGEPETIRAIVLATARERLSLPVNAGLAALGRDRLAIDPGNRADELFDLGLGMAVAQFCIRSGAPDVLDGLGRATGAAWPAFLQAFGGELLRRSPHRVVQTAIGRIEVLAPIPPPGAGSPPGPHTHFLPETLAARMELPPGSELPAFYAPAAMYHPQRAGHSA